MHINKGYTELPIGSLLKHQGGMYAYIREITPNGYKVYYAGGNSTWLEIKFDQTDEWDLIRQGY